MTSSFVPKRSNYSKDNIPADLSSFNPLSYKKKLKDAERLYKACSVWRSSQLVSQSSAKKTHPKQRVRHLKSLTQTDLWSVLRFELSQS